MDAAPTIPTTSIRARCACGTFNFPIEWPTAALPVKYALCACDSCRHATGSFGASDVHLPDDVYVDPEELGLQVYQSSEQMKRYFCKTCGALTLFQSSGRWMICVALFDKRDGLFILSDIIWAADTVDGGLSIWLPNSVEQQNTKAGACNVWAREAGGPVFKIPRSAANTSERVNPESRLKDEERLNASCLCGGVQFSITRPNTESSKVRSPWPDLIKPYHSSSPENTDNVTWWIREKGTKYLAGTCVCPSCILSLGCEVQSWTFVPKCNIILRDGSQLDLSAGQAKLASLKRYHSSSGVFREFCSTCGATVFWHCEERPDLIDVSVGLLQSTQGSRAEDWLEWWTERVSFAELGSSKEFVEMLEAGLKG